MKFKLQAGQEVDVLDAAEAREIVAELLERVRADREIPVRMGEGGQTDGAGAVTIPVYVVPLGREFALNRLLVDADGYTPAAPYTNAAGYIDVRRGGVRVDFVGLSNGIPALSIDGKETANRFRNGETVEVVIVGGPANTSIQVEIHGMLRAPEERPQARVRRVR